MLASVLVFFSGFGLLGDLLGDLESSPISEPCDITSRLSKRGTPVVFRDRLSTALEFRTSPCQNSLYNTHAGQSPTFYLTASIFNLAPILQTRTSSFAQLRCRGDPVGNFA